MCIIFEKIMDQTKTRQGGKKVILLYIFVLLAITTIVTYNVGATTPKII
jgi:hypothetical protein